MVMNIYEGNTVGHLSDREYLHGAVTCLVRGKTRDILAAGHGDGSVLVYGTESLVLAQRFSLHSSAVTCLCFDKEVLRGLSVGIYTVQRKQGHDDNWVRFDSVFEFIQADKP